MRHRNLWLFLLLAAVWGTAFVAIKAGLAFFPPVLFAALRYDVAGLVMLAYAAYAADRWRPETAGEWRLVAIGGLFLIAGYHAFLFVGQQYTTSAAAAVIVALNPVLTTGFARGLLPGERLAPAGLLGLVLGLAGVVVLARPDATTLLGGGMTGELLVLAAVSTFALGSVLTRRDDATLPVETMQSWSMLVGAVAMHAASPLVGESLASVRWTPGAVASLGYLALAASALGFLIYFDLLERLGPVEINLVSYVVPLFAAAVGWLLLAEVVTAATVVGFVLILLGFGLIKREELAGEVERVRRARAG